MTTDTEALKALVAKWRKEAWHGPGETQYRMGRGHSADELESALERMPASQMGEPFGWLRANGHFERGAELISKHPQDAEGAIPLYAAPQAEGK